MNAITHIKKGLRKIELTIDSDYDSYSDAERQKLLGAIGDLLDIKDAILIVGKCRGSVKLTLALRPEEAEKLHLLANQGALKEFKVMRAKLLGGRVVPKTGVERTQTTTKRTPTKSGLLGVARTSSKTAISTKTVSKAKAKGADHRFQQAPKVNATLVPCVPS
jgi:hypothetical protein